MIAVYMSLIEEADDKEAFRNLYNQYKNLMMNVAMSILKNHQDAEDAVSEAFLRIAQNFQIVNKEICPKTAKQFVIIVRNVSINFYRKNQREEVLPLIYDVPDEEFDSFDAGKIQDALDKLNQEDRDLLYLHYIYGCPIKDIPKLIGKKPDAIYKKLQRAKQRLKKILEAETERNDYERQ